MNKKDMVKGLVLVGSGVVGGFVIGGVTVTKAMLSSDDVREVLAKKLSDKIMIWLYGDDYVSPRRRHISYREYYTRKHPRSTEEYTYDPLYFYKREDAEHVLENMKNVIDQYGLVTVTDMYDLADETAPHTAYKYGWTSLKGVEIEYVSKHGYSIDLPKPLPVY